MTKLYSCPPQLKRPSRSTCENLMEKAKTEDSWEYLKPYPMLLFFWQANHYKKDSIPIAKFVSHFRTGKHKWCVHQ